MAKAGPQYITVSLPSLPLLNKCPKGKRCEKEGAPLGNNQLPRRPFGFQTKKRPPGPRRGNEEVPFGDNNAAYFAKQGRLVLLSSPGGARRPFGHILRPEGTSLSESSRFEKKSPQGTKTPLAFAPTGGQRSGPSFNKLTFGPLASQYITARLSCPLGKAQYMPPPLGPL